MRIAIIAAAFVLVCSCQTFRDLPYRDQIWVLNFRANAVEYYGKGIYRQLQSQVLRETALATTGRPKLNSPLFDRDYKPDPKANQISLRSIYGPPQTPDDYFTTN